MLKELDLLRTNKIILFGLVCIAGLLFAGSAQAAAPTLTAFSAPLDVTDEDTEVEITLAEMETQGDEADDGTVVGFVIKAVSSGTLKIGADAGSAIAWAASTNDTVQAGSNAYWTPAADASGTLNAFTAVALDDEAGESNPAVQAQVTVNSINDNPTLGAFSAALDTTDEDTEVEITFAEMQAQGDEGDVDGTVDGFVVKAISGGTLKIGANAGSATAWAASTNDTVQAGSNAYWTPAADANGTLDAFTAVALDNQSAESTPAVQAQVTVNSINDNPTLTAFASVLDATDEDTEVEITFAEMQAQGDEADDGAVVGFVIKAVSDGTLKIGADAGSATAWAASTNDTVQAGSNAYWTPAADTSGTLNAFTAVALDDEAGESSPAVQAQVTVSAVNDQPIFSGLDATPAYTENSTAIILDADVTVFDEELDVLANYGGASLTIARTGGADTADSFGFEEVGASFTVSGTDLQSGGQTFASYSDSAGTLTINFTGSGTTATVALVNDVLQRITYANTSLTPVASAQLDWTFDDGNSGGQGTGGALTDVGSVTVSITDKTNVVIDSFRLRQPDSSYLDVAGGSLLPSGASAPAHGDTLNYKIRIKNYNTAAENSAGDYTYAKVTVTTVSGVNLVSFNCTAAPETPVTATCGSLVTKAISDPALVTFASDSQEAEVDLVLQVNQALGTEMQVQVDVEPVDSAGSEKSDDIGGTLSYSATSVPAGTQDMIIFYDATPGDAIIEAQNCQVSSEIVVAGTGAMDVTLLSCNDKLVTVAGGAGNQVSFYYNGGLQAVCNYESFQMWSDGIQTVQVLKLSADCLSGNENALADDDDDGDGLSLTQELVAGTNPFSADTDGDGVSDSDEINSSTDPTDPNSTPARCSTQATVTVAGPVTYGLTNIEACEAQTSITTSGSVVLSGDGSSGADVAYKAPLITLSEGFTVQAGAQFHAGAAINISGYTKSTKSIESDSTTVVSSTKSASISSGAKTVMGPIRLGQDQLPAKLQALLDTFGAVAEDAFADATGAYVVFATNTGLAENDQNGVSDVYVYEISTDTLTAISLNEQGYTANGPSRQPRIDGGGNYIVYASEASDLAEGDSNGVSDIFIHVLAIGLTERVSLDIDGNEAVSAAYNPAIASAHPQILYDRIGAEGTRQVYSYDYSWPAVGTQQLSIGETDQGTATDSHHPAVSADGHFVAYLETQGTTPGTAECSVVVYDQLSNSFTYSACTADAVQDETYKSLSVNGAGMVSFW